MEGIKITSRNLNYQIKVIEDIIKTKQKLGKPTKYEEELVEAWKLELSHLTTGRKIKPIKNLANGKPHNPDKTMSI